MLRWRTPESVVASKRALRPNGIYVMIPGSRLGVDAGPCRLVTVNTKVAGPMMAPVVLAVLTLGGLAAVGVASGGLDDPRFYLAQAVVSIGLLAALAVPPEPGNGGVKLRGLGGLSLALGVIALRCSCCHRWRTTPALAEQIGWMASDSGSPAYHISRAWCLLWLVCGYCKAGNTPSHNRRKPNEF